MKVPVEQPWGPPHVSTRHHPFLEQRGAEEWDAVAYAPGTYDSFIWELERDLLLPLVSELRSRRLGVKYLDFACGTGRVLTVVQPLTSVAHGLDVSDAMVRRAAAKVPAASVRLGDLLARPEVADEDYDLITAFRFFLNAEPQVRLPYLAGLGSRLRDADSRLVFNIHANAWGLDGLASRTDHIAVMSPGEVHRLVHAAGLEVVSWHGLGLMPACRDRLRVLKRRMRSFDRWAAGQRWLRRVSRDLIFVCRRQPCE